MNDSILQAEPDFEWYQTGNWPALRQGDLLPNCFVLVPPADLVTLLENVKQGATLEGGLIIQRADLIILSQSCDLENEKIQQILLCACFPASSLSKSDRNPIRRGQRPALHMIERCHIQNMEFDRQVIDFRTIYTLPKDFVMAYATSLGARTRLLPPYRGHLSQAFARYFMRVGLPHPLDDD
jgi:hypothetical protein